MNYNFNTTIDEKGIVLLNSLIDKNLISFGYEPDSVIAPDIFETVNFTTNIGIFHLNNHVDWLDDYFSGGDFTPHMLFDKYEDGIIKKYGLETGYTEHQINERIVDIILVQDHLDIYKDNKDFQKWDSTEGVIIETEVRQYAFYKHNTFFDETVLFFKGHDVTSKLEPLEKHWDIFGRPFSADPKRKIVSLTKGTLIEITGKKIIGVD